MPNDRVTQVTDQSWLWSNRFMWSVVTMLIMGSIARALMSDTPFDLRRFVGEIIFSAIGAVFLYSMGLMQGMNEIQIVCFGASASLGGVRFVEWAIKIMEAVRRSGTDV